MKFNSFFSLAAFVGAALADVTVQVGLNGTLRFSPETVTANPGEKVFFQFHTSTHSATESTARLADPCHPLGGFDTGIQPNGATQHIIITTHNSIYVHCTPHCGKGMVMIVNPGPNDSVEKFRAAAIAQEGGGSGGGGGGGSSTTTSTSGSRTATKTSTLGSGSGSGSSSASGSAQPTGSSASASSPATTLTAPGGGASASASGSGISGSGSGSGSLTGIPVVPTSGVSGSSSLTASPSASSTGSALTFTPNALTLFFSSLLAMIL